MLTLERCREILGDDCPKSDAELELLRDQCYGLADVVCAAFVEERKKPRNAPQNAPQGEIRADDTGDGIRHAQELVGGEEAVAMLSEEERDDLQERAATMEFDGGLGREAAERAAFSDLWRRKRQRK